MDAKYMDKTSGILAIYDLCNEITGEAVSFLEEFLVLPVLNRQTADLAGMVHRHDLIAKWR